MFIKKSKSKSGLAKLSEIVGEYMREGIIHVHVEARAHNRRRHKYKIYQKAFNIHVDKLFLSVIDELSKATLSAYHQLCATVAFAVGFKTLGPVLALLVRPGHTRCVFF